MSFVDFTEIHFHQKWLRCTFPQIGRRPYYYHEMSYTFQGIVHLGIPWKRNWFLVRVNLSEIGIWHFNMIIWQNLCQSWAVLVHCDVISMMSFTFRYSNQLARLRDRKWTRVLVPVRPAGLPPGEAARHRVQGQTGSGSGKRQLLRVLT